MSALVSIIVPVYGISRYLDRCVESLLRQTYQNLEIILVDDGSPDDCPQKCDAWQRRDPRVRVIHQRNTGLGMARNAGLDRARGEYVCFFDGDDHVAPETIEKACAAAVKYDAETVLFGVFRENAKGGIYQRVVPKTPKLLYTGDEVRSYVLPNLLASPTRKKDQANLWMSAWSCLYSAGLIRRVGWRFVSEREVISEDVYSLLRLYADVRRTAIVPEPLYYYCERESSLSRVYRPDRYEKIKKCYLICGGLCDELDYPHEVRDRLALQFLANVIGALKSIAAADKDRRKTVGAILRDECLQSALARVDLHREKAERSALFFAMRMKKTGAVLFLLDVKMKLNGR